MFGLPIGLLIRVGAVLAAAAALWFAWHELTGHYEQIGRDQVQTQWNADIAKRNKATADMALLWDSKRQEAEKAGEERDHERQLRAEEAQQRARTLPRAVADLPFPAAAVRMLDESTVGDTTAPAGPAVESEETAPAAAPSADSTVGLVTEWGTTVKTMYQACLDRVVDWQRFYQSLRDAQPKESP